MMWWLCIHWWQIKHIDNVDNYGKTNNTNATPITQKIFYKSKENVCAFLFLFLKNIVMYYINVYPSLFQVLSDVRTAVHQYEHVSANRCPTNACYYKFHYPNSFTIDKISWKYSSFVSFNIGFFPLFFTLFCKISVKG